MLNRTITLLLITPLLLAGGCRHSAPPTATTPPLPAATNAPIPTLSEALKLSSDSPQLVRMVIESQKKRAVGRLTSLTDIQRVVNEDGPLIAQAAQQPEVQSALQQMANDDGTTLEEARTKWMRFQEADILLESGGNPEDVSSANAVGVAQWIAETATRAGLKIDRAASKRLTAKIDDLKRQVAWREYLLRPGANPKIPGAPPIMAAQAEAQLPSLRSTLEQLRAKRRLIDPRYDPRQALFAHAKYLLGLYPRFPSMDWIAQAFHGGEAGVQRTLHKYLGKSWPGTTAAAIRHGKSGGWLRFEPVYFTASPTSHAEAFSYLYGRLDDHRYYWWKLRAAQEAIALYRKDPAAFQKQWEGFLPGRAKEATWYPNAAVIQIGELPAVQAAVANKTLVQVADSTGLKMRPTLLDPANSRKYTVLKPESRGALLLVESVYRKYGGKGTLRVGDLTLTKTYSENARKKFALAMTTQSLLPPPANADILIGGGPPGDFDFHTTGLAFDILPPKEPLQRKTLENALGWLSDRHILWWREEKDKAGLRYHAVPNPRYAADLAHHL